MKTKNPSKITLALREVNKAIIAIAKRISERVTAKRHAGFISCFGDELAMLNSVHLVLDYHERSGRRELLPESLREIILLIDRYDEKKFTPDAAWIIRLRELTPL